MSIYGDPNWDNNGDENKKEAGVEEKEERRMKIKLDIPLWGVSSRQKKVKLNV